MGDGPRSPREPDGPVERSRILLCSHCRVLILIAAVHQPPPFCFVCGTVPFIDALDPSLL